MNSGYFSYTFYLGCICFCCVNNFCDINAEPYNIALGKSTDQGPEDWCDRNRCYTSDLAVDGIFSTDVNIPCSHTDNTGTVQGSWWSVDFQEHYYLASIRILRRYNVNDTWIRHRMDGLTINGEPGNQLIFSDSSPSITDRKRDIRIALPASLEEIKFTGINISIPGPLLTLCEVQVYAGRSCGINLPTLTNGNWTSANTFSDCYFYGCSYTGNCSTGYTQSGTIRTTCSEDASWTTPVVRCHARSCGTVLPTMSNGNWIPLGTGVGCYYYTCSYSFSCKTGYAPSGTNPILTYCSSDGKWTTSNGSCLVRFCSSNLPNMSNGIWTSRNAPSCYYYSCSYTFACAQGYSRSGTNAILTYCSAVGIWSAPAGTCQAARSCSNNLPTVLNSYMLSLNATSSCYYIGCVYIFSCKRGYIRSGRNPITTTCNANGMWTAPVDDCRDVSIAEKSQTSGLTALTGGLIGAGTVFLIGIAGLVAAVICVLLKRKRNKPKTDDLYETRLNPDEPRLYSALDETVRTATVDTGEPEQIGDSIVNSEYEACEEIKHTNQEYSNLQI